MTTDTQLPNALDNNVTVEPLVPASQNLPEITVKAVILAIFLVIILAAANAYLGLKVGTTVSASIPAAVISMGILRLFRKSNVLENNIVQTAASAGEAVVAGIAYILPALLIIHFWQEFNYWETVLIAMIGGILGVLFSVPLRRVLLSQKILPFPEGTAIGQVLRASIDRGAGLGFLVKGGLVGGFISLCQTGFQVISNQIEFWFRSPGGTFVYGGGFGFDPALMAAGYIVGINIGLSLLLGVAIGWLVGVPILTHMHGIPLGDAGKIAADMWHSHIRYIGVGTMLVGGFWTLIILAKPILDGLRTSFTSVKVLRDGKKLNIPRTERDIPIYYVVWGLLITAVPLGLLLWHFVANSILPVGPGLETAAVVIAVLFIIFIGFIFSAIGGYFAGLVGSTNSPGSALTLSSLLLMCLLIMVLFGAKIHFTAGSEETLAAAALAVVIASVIGAANVITCETIQDLKAGQIVGATPWKQQVMLIIGAIVASFIIPLVLQLLFQAYGIGGVFPRAGMDPSQTLAAPQAGLMAAIAQGIFEGSLPWNMIDTGMVIAIICIAIDRYLRRYTKSGSLPVLAVGLGIYLPLSASMPFVLGGIVSYFVNRTMAKRHASNSEADVKAICQGQQRGLILACGIVAGAALMGVILAIPFAIYQSSDVLKLVSNKFIPIASILGVMVVIALLSWIYRSVCREKTSK